MLSRIVVILKKRLVGVAEATRHALEFIQNVVYLTVLLGFLASRQLVLFLGLTALLLPHKFSPFLRLRCQRLATVICIDVFELFPALLFLLKVDLRKVLFKTNRIEHAAFLEWYLS